MRLTPLIKILERVRPYTFQPGAKIIIPFTSQGITVYPTEIRMHGGQAFPIKTLGPIDKFMATLDLERGEVHLFGKGAKDHFHVSLNNESGNIVYKIHKGDERLFEEFSFPKAKFNASLELPRLSFGVTKSQEFEKIVARQNLQEILPIWFRFGAMIKTCTRPKEPSLLASLVNEEKPSDSSWLPLFRAGFSSLFYPESEDQNLFGYALPPIGKGESPLSILRFGYEKILQLLVDEREDGHLILPGMFRISKAGKAVSIPFSLGTIDLEWTKGFLRRVRILANSQGKVLLKFPKHHRQARLNLEKTVSLSPLLELDLADAGEYFLDHFEE